MKTERWGRLRNKIACNNTHNNGTELFLGLMWNRTSRCQASTLAIHPSVRKTRGNCFEWKIIKVNWCELANASRLTSKKKAEEEEKLNGERAAERMEELSFHVSRRRLFVAFFFRDSDSSSTLTHFFFCAPLLCCYNSIDTNWNIDSCGVWMES